MFFCCLLLINFSFFFPPNRLWDHLDSNLDSYVHPEESYVNEVLKTKPAADDSHRVDSESERVKTSKESNSRHRREWKGLVRDADEPPPLRSSVVEKIHLEEKPHQRRRVRTDHGKRSPSPRSVGLRKRSRPDDQENIKVWILNFFSDYKELMWKFLGEKKKIQNIPLCLCSLFIKVCTWS